MDREEVPNISSLNPNSAADPSVAHTEIREVCEWLSRVNDDTVERREELGQAFKFTELLPDLERVRKVAAALAGPAELGLLTSAQLTKLHITVADMREAVLGVLDFVPVESADDATARRRGRTPQGDVIRKFREAEQKLISEYSSSAPMLLLLDDQTALAGAHAELQSLMTQIREAKDEVEQARQGVRDASAEVGVDSHVPEFDSAAAAYRKQAGLALLAAGAFVLVLLLLLLWFWRLGHPSGDEVADAVYTTSLRVSALAIPALGLAVSLRVFSASRHNEIVNSHRSQALKTFQTFVSGASEPSVKDAVLIEATRSVFAGQASGYLGNDGADAPSQSMMLEVVRQVQKST